MTARIQRIDHIRGFGSFRDWDRDGDLPDFARYNLVYGWNGSGKTTLARLLRMLETRQVHDAADIELLDFGLTLDNEAALGQDDIEHPRLAVRVFNEDFVDENLQFKTATASSFLILGEERIEAAQERDELKEMSGVVEAELETVRSEHSAVSRDRSRLLSSTAKRIKERLRVGPDARFHNYEKPDVEAALQQIPEGDIRPPVDVSFEEGRLVSSPLSVLDVKQAPEVEQLAVLWSELADVLATEVAGDVIEELRSDSAAQRWVETGVPLHEGRDERCLFCTQPLPPDRLEALHQHFSDQFAQHAASIADLEARFERLQSDANEYEQSVSSIKDDRLYVDSLDQWIQARHRLTRAFTLVNKLVACGLESLAAKAANPWEKSDTPYRIERVISIVARVESALSTMSEQNDAHMARRSGIDEVRREAQRNLEVDMIWDARQEYLDLRDASEDLQDAIDDLGSCLEQLAERIGRLEAEAAGTDHTIERLNSALGRFFGHDVFAVGPSPSANGVVGLVLMRHGRPATWLSAGERTGIALVYFLLRLLDDNTDLANTIVVIDDPVSSLDSGALYQAFSYIYELTAECLQLLVLTHDFRLFRLMRNRFGEDGHYGNRDDTEMFMIVKPGVEVESSSAIVPIEPTLKSFDSEYHYLYVCVKRFAEGAVEGVPSPREMPNVTRRLLEAFLAFKLPSKKDSIGAKLSELVGDTAETQRILRFVHDHSHVGGLASFERIGAVDNDEARQVARDVMALIEQLDTDHASVMRNNQ